MDIPNGILNEFIFYADIKNIVDLSLVYWSAYNPIIDNLSTIQMVIIILPLHLDIGI